MGAIGGFCPFLERKCKCRKTKFCSAVTPWKEVDEENCEDFLDCLKYEEKMVEVRKLL